VHPASILRAGSDGARQEQRAAFVDDLAGIVRNQREIDA
jgi:hypothetical protein